MPAMKEHVEDVECLTGKGFGAKDNPLLISVRLRRSSVNARHDGHCASSRPQQEHLKWSGGTDGQSPVCVGFLSLIHSAIWQSRTGCTGDMANGTAVNVVAMVFGNMGDDSGTGAAFTRNLGTGKNELFGEYFDSVIT